MGVRVFKRANGAEIKLDTALLVFNAEEIEAETEQVAPNLALVGDLLGEWEARRQVRNAEYKQWGSRKKLEQVALDPKLAEWKADAAVEADDEYLLHKTDLAALNSDVTFLESYFEALRVQAQMLDVRARRQRIEWDRTERTTSVPARAPMTGKPEPEGDRADRVRAAMSRDRSDRDPGKET